MFFLSNGHIFFFRQLKKKNLTSRYCPFFVTINCHSLYSSVWFYLLSAILANIFFLSSSVIFLLFFSRLSHTLVFRIVCLFWKETRFLFTLCLHCFSHINITYPFHTFSPNSFAFSFFFLLFSKHLRLIFFCYFIFCQDSSGSSLASFRCLFCINSLQSQGNLRSIYEWFPVVRFLILHHRNIINVKSYDFWFKPENNCKMVVKIRIFEITKRCWKYLTKSLSCFLLFLKGILGQSKNFSVSLVYSMKREEILNLTICMLFILFFATERRQKDIRKGVIIWNVRVA